MMRWMTQNKLKGVTVSMNKNFCRLPYRTQIFLNTILGIKEVSLREMSGIKYSILDDLVKPLH